MTGLRSISLDADSLDAHILGASANSVNPCNATKGPHVGPVLPRGAIHLTRRGPFARRGEGVTMRRIGTCKGV